MGKPGGGRKKHTHLDDLHCRWEDSKKTDLEERVLEVVVLIHVGQERSKWLAYVNMVMISHVSAGVTWLIYMLCHCFITCVLFYGECNNTV